MKQPARRSANSFRKSTWIRARPQRIPWGQDFVLNCTEDEIFVVSLGPDKKKGTKDDIQIPKATAVTGEQGN